MTSLQCCICKHYWGMATCKAFNPFERKKIIPEKIWTGRAHNKPLKNQGNNIVFEPFEEEIIGENND